LKDTDLEASDQAAHICPTGAILIKRTGYTVPIGERIYDHKQIDEVALAEESRALPKEKDHG
ncbi:MAG: NADP oxidoreductase, partial [Methylococcaceae bacterium]|nr:NADP oxidoreductase [Methylococcaceae bacterium]